MTRLSWNEMRLRAAEFSREWQDAAYEKGETQSFYDAFFNIFDLKRRDVARYEEHVRKLDNSYGFIDLFLPGKMIVEQKSVGRNLAKAYEQAGEYFDALRAHERPRYILASDFQSFELHDLDERRTTKFKLANLSKHIEAFAFLIDLHPREFGEQDPANIKAAELVGHLYDTLVEAGGQGKGLERFLVQIVFCMFADDTDLFEPPHIFLNFIENRTNEDGSDLGPRLRNVFQVLNTPVKERDKNLDEDLDQFPYINGELFIERPHIPSFNSKMRLALIEACKFDWSKISPAIFGALFQSVMDQKERREKGAHYTTEQNILKVIGPLFMDDLRTEFRKVKKRSHKRIHALLEFQEKLGKLKFLDPACGCGNFLVITYRELRLLEIEVIKEIRKKNVNFKQSEIDTAWGSKVDVDQFHGIEIGKFPSRIAETALWMMDHIMNNQLSVEFGEYYARIPLKKSPQIICGDALEMDWSQVLAPSECSYILGNPPFKGAKLQSRKERSQVKEIVERILLLDSSKNGKKAGTLDYVAAWFLKAGEYLATSSARIGFVATNSITQGEQVAQLWQLLFELCRLEIAFAHRTFAWGSDARGKANVHVVILGLDGRDSERKTKRLYSYANSRKEAEESCHPSISPYLFDASKLMDPHLVVREMSEPISPRGKMVMGSKPIDGGHYIFNDQERKAFLKVEPKAKKFLRPFASARDFLHGNKRWILALHSLTATERKNLPEVGKRISKVRRYRKDSSSLPTRKLAEYPRQYHLNVLPATPYLAIPRISSERRGYVPIGWLQPPAIPSDSMVVLDDATLTDFALLTSTMHMAWLRYIGGRLESRYRYSIGLVYNTFPLPPKKVDPKKIDPLAQAVLDARAAEPNSTLADLYDPDFMPAKLVKAHQRLDRAVDKLYRPAKFNSEMERVEHLLALYEKTLAPLEHKVRQKPKKPKPKKEKEPDKKKKSTRKAMPASSQPWMF